MRPWTEWVELGKDHVILDGRRLPAHVYFGRPKPEDYPEEIPWGVGNIPLESGICVSLFVDVKDPNGVFCSLVVDGESPIGEVDWLLCWTGEPGPEGVRRYRRCRPGPRRVNWIDKDINRAVREIFTDPESVWDLLRFASSVELVQ